MGIAFAADLDRVRSDELWIFDVVATVAITQLGILAVLPSVTRPTPKLAVTLHMALALGQRFRGKTKQT